MPKLLLFYSEDMTDVIEFVLDELEDFGFVCTRACFSELAKSRGLEQKFQDRAVEHAAEADVVLILGSPVFFAEPAMESVARSCLSKHKTICIVDVSHASTCPNWFPAQSVDLLAELELECTKSVLRQLLSPPP